MRKILIILIFVFAYNLSFADKCKDYLLVDGSETINKYGIDSTGNWWIKTMPFSNQYRFVMENYSSDVFVYLYDIVFSPDGNNWAFFGRDNTQWYLVTKNEKKAINCTKPGFIRYSIDSEQLIYSYYEGEIETIISDKFQIKVNNRISGSFVTNQNGSLFAFKGNRGDREVVNINGKESDTYERIIPFGFWNNGEFIYATKSGSTWDIRKGNKILIDGYTDIIDYAININENCLGLLVKSYGNNYYGIIISDDYYEPLISKNYETLYNLTLHPYLPMMAYNASFNGSNFIVFSNTEYTGGNFTSRPYFTHDGSEMYYFGCNIDCFINIGGVKYTQNTVYSLDVPYTHKPNSKSIAYTASYGLLVKDLISNTIYSGMMVDETTNSFFNWKKNRYEALGRINNKIYLLTCTF